MSRRPNKIALTLSASWGYDVDVELELSERNWKRISVGRPFTIRGHGYAYEGEHFWDFWDFNEKCPRSLTVRYGSARDGDYSGVGLETEIDKVSSLTRST